MNHSQPFVFHFKLSNQHSKFNPLSLKTRWNARAILGSHTLLTRRNVTTHKRLTLRDLSSQISRNRQFPFIIKSAVCYAL